MTNSEHHIPLTWVYSLLSLVLLMTVPRLVINYGMDGDAIRSLIAAHGIWTGPYVASRAPGNPLYEYILAGLIRIDRQYITNGFSLLSYFFAVTAFYKLCKDKQNSRLILVIFSVTPIIVVNAAVTMDYLPGLALVLWSYVFLRTGHIVVAGMLLGTAAGMRVSHLMFLLPFSMYTLTLFAKRQTAKLLFSGAISFCLVFSPILIQSGVLSFFGVSSIGYVGSDYVLYTGYRFIMLFGTIGTLVLSFIILVNARGILQITYKELTAKNPEALLETTSLILILLIFLLHSDESEYLIPAVPFLLLWISNKLSQRHIILLGLALFSYAFVSIDLRGGESGKRTLGFTINPGIIIGDYLQRKQLEAIRSGMGNLPDKSVIMTGYGPMLLFENRTVESFSPETAWELVENGISEPNFSSKVIGRGIYYVNGLSAENVVRLQNVGLEIYYFSESLPSLAMHKFGYHPADLGLQPIRPASLAGN